MVDLLHKPLLIQYPDKSFMFDPVFDANMTIQRKCVPKWLIFFTNIYTCMIQTNRAGCIALYADIAMPNKSDF